MAFIGRGINTVRTVGDQEMTGRLTIKKSDNQMVCLTTALNQNPSNVIYTDNYGVRSADGLSSVYFCTSNHPGNEIRGRIVVHKSMNNRDYFAEIGVSLDSNGKSFAYAPNSNQVGSVVTTAGIGSNYVLLGNGLKIQWGAGTGQQTFSIPFETVGYMIADSDLTYHKYEGMWTTNKTTTGFLINNSSSAQWIAIGY